MNSKRMNILLVEDEPSISLVHRTFLESFGCNVTVAINSHEALDKLQQPFNLIFMDIGIPDITGIEVVEIYRKQEKLGKPLPIIFLTSHQESAMLQKCIDVGGNAVFNKPISKSSLCKIVNFYRP